MTSRSVLSAIAAGLLAVVLVVVSAKLPGLGTVAGFLSPVPLIVVGLTRGFRYLVVALAMAMVVFSVFVGILSGVAYGAVDGVPVLVIGWLALRQVPVGDGKANWVSTGDILGWLSVAVLVMVAAGLVVLSNGDFPNEGDIAGRIEAMLRQTLEAFFGGLPDEVGGLSLEAVSYAIPGFVGVGCVARAIMAAVISQSVAEKLGKSLRPTPRYGALSMPKWISVALGLAIIVAVVGSGDLRLHGASAAIILSFPLLLQGLSVVHVAVRALPMPSMWLTVFYVVFLLSSVVAQVAMVGLGLVDQLTRLRSHIGGARRQEDV